MNTSQLKEKLDIVDVIQKFISLEKCGANFKGLCPFHNDSKPSFIVSPTKQIATCFVCGKTYDVFQFVMEKERIPFPEAATKLAQLYNLKLDLGSKEISEEFHKYLSVMRKAQSFFKKKLLETREAMSYLLERGFNPEDCDEYGIGFAGDSWDELYSELSKEYDTDFLIEVGLVKKGDSGQIYDTFRGRIMFPVNSQKGDVIAFGGRLISGKGPKYLNSKETKFYKKKDNLFFAKGTLERIKEHGYAVLVEGYFDVLTAKKNGVETPVAALGTSFTLEQSLFLKKFTNNIILCLDDDEAGKKAAFKTSDLLLKEGMKPLVVKGYKGKKDIDEFFTEYSFKDFTILLKDSCDGIEFITGRIASLFNLDNRYARIEFLREIKEQTKEYDIPTIEEFVKLSSQMVELNYLKIEEYLKDGINVVSTLDEAKRFAISKVKEKQEFSDIKKEAVSLLITEALTISEVRDLYNSKIHRA